MKATLHRGFARLAGLLVLSLLVVATGVQAALAATLEGTGAGTGSITVSQAASSGLSSTTVWIAAGAVAAAVLIAGIAAWTLARRQRRPSEAAPLRSVGPLAEASSAQQPESWEDSQREDSQRRAA